MKIFKSNSINYKFIFNFDMCSYMNNALFLSTVSIMLSMNVLSFMFLNTFYISLIIAFQAVVLFNPFDIVFYNSRVYLISVFLRAIFFQFSTVRFRHYYFIDLLFYIFVYNLLVRSLWILNYLNIDPSLHIARACESWLEIIRRFFWTQVRVEVEHLNNYDQLKLNKAINLTSGELFYKKDQEAQKREVVPEEKKEETNDFNATTETDINSVNDSANESFQEDIYLTIGSFSLSSDDETMFSSREL